MYSPEIRPELVKSLYQLKLKEGRPITKIANEAIEIYLANKLQNEEEESNERRK